MFPALIWGPSEFEEKTLLCELPVTDMCFQSFTKANLIFLSAAFLSLFHSSPVLLLSNHISFLVRDRSVSHKTCCGKSGQNGIFQLAPDRVCL